MTIEELGTEINDRCPEHKRRLAAQVFNTWLKPYLKADVDAISHVGVEGDTNLELILLVDTGEESREKAWRIIDRMCTAGLRFNRVGVYQQTFPPIAGVEICFAL